MTPEYFAFWRLDDDMERKNLAKRNQRKRLCQKNYLPRLPNDAQTLNIVNSYRSSVTSTTLIACQSCDVLQLPSNIKSVCLESPTLSIFKWETPTTYGANPSFHPVIAGDGMPRLLHARAEQDGVKELDINLCKRCAEGASASKPQKMPLMALVNGCWTGSESFGLTFLEEMIVCINHVRGVVLRISSSGIEKTRGNFVVLPNDSNIKFSSLPVGWKYLPEILQVVLDKGWQRQALVEHLTVRKNVIRNALLFLKKNSPAYKDIEILLEDVPEDGVPEVVIDLCVHDVEKAAPEDIFDHLDGFGANLPNHSIASSVSEVPSNAPDDVLMREHLHLRSLGEAQPDFFDDSVWDTSFPTIFPFGSRQTLSSKASHSAKEEWLTHQLLKRLPTPRKHPTFLFYLRDLRNRLTAAQRASAVVAKSEFPETHFSRASVEKIIKEMKNDTREQSKYCQEIIKNARYTTAPCVGSDGWSLGSRYRLYAMNFKHGRPTFWITLNFNTKDKSFESFTGSTDRDDGVLVALYIDFMWKAFLDRLTPLLGGGGKGVLYTNRKSGKWRSSCSHAAMVLH